ncbi:MAG: 1-acyl-sn-glycerol-3-phosphate acyltransferase [Acidimicrobiia bacterium]|nr:1-acyl-sn-glycerol-3-phosphate acyltransferase [Acidimicrobiia bacterium]
MERGCEDGTPRRVSSCVRNTSGCIGGWKRHPWGMSEPMTLIPRPATSLVRMLVGEVKVVGTVPEGPVLLCGNHNSYRDVFLFGMVRASARLLVHPLVFSFPFLKKYALRWGFVQVSIDDAVALLKQGQTVAICPTGLVEALGDAELPFKTGAVRIAQQAGVPMVPVYFHYGNYPGRWVTPFSITVQNMLLFCLWPFYRRGVTIVIGEPLDPAGEVKARTQELKAAVVGLKPTNRV